MSGRWSLLPQAEPDPTRRLHALARTLLDRHGILIRGAVAAERVTGGFGALYPVLRAMEEAASAAAGYFVEGLGARPVRAAGRGGPDARDGRTRRRLGRRSSPRADPWRGPAGCHAGPAVTVLAAADPANAYGAALPWPARPDETPGGHRPGRKAGRAGGAGRR